MSAQSCFFGFELLSGFATLLVIIGLFKEYGLDVLKAFKFWGTRETHAHIEIETASRRQGSALVVIGIAIELIGTVGIFLTSLRIETQHRSEIVRLENATAKIRDETAKKELELEQGASMLGSIFFPRRVALSSGPNGPIGKEFDILRTFAGTRTALVAAPDLESVQLAVDIGAALQVAGWAFNGLTVLRVDQAYPLVGVHISVDTDAVPAPPIADAAFELTTYLSFGYLRDLGLNSSAGIEAHRAVVIGGNKFRPEWWPIGFVPPANTLCVLVGRKDFTQELNDRASFKQVPEKFRKLFLEHETPWIQ